jgi:hypothetical protein
VAEANFNASVKVEALCSVTFSVGLAVYINQMGAFCALVIQLLLFVLLWILTALWPKRHQTLSIGVHELLSNYQAYFTDLCE